MNGIKDIVSLILGGRLLIEGQGRTFAKLPVWLAVIAALWSLKLAALTLVLVVAFGMKASIVRA